MLATCYLRSTITRADLQVLEEGAADGEGYERLILPPGLREKVVSVVREAADTSASVTYSQSPHPLQKSKIERRGCDEKTYCDLRDRIGDSRAVFG